MADIPPIRTGLAEGDYTRNHQRIMTSDPEHSITEVSRSIDPDSGGNTTTWWGLFEQWSAMAFLLGGLLMVIDAAFVAANVITGAQHFLLLGEVFVGAAWTAALVGLLGLYPGLADRSRWLSRAGVVFIVIGMAVFPLLAVASLGYYTGILTGEFDTTVFIPGVLIGSVLGFGLFSAAILRTGVHSQSVGILLLVPPILVVTNILRFVAGFEAATITLAVVIGDALAMLAIGYVLRSSPEPTGPAEPAPGEVRHG